MRLVACFAVVALTTLLGCKQQVQQSDCDALCHELVYTCAYAAFPSIDSCVQGCTYNADQGADVGGQLACVQESSCDTFAIVECEHAYGLD